MGSPRALLLACHPLPATAVTAFITGYALVVGLSVQRSWLLAAAVLAGQLSIGWGNDAVDSVRDTAAGRTDKPVAVGAVRPRVVIFAAGLALAACVSLSFRLGAAPGTVHLVAVAAGWVYNLGVKATPASGLPYLLAFGLLPGVACRALPDPGWPPAGVTAGAALLGLAAHFANTVPDAAADAATGVRGLPQRIGAHASMVVTAALVTAAAVVLLVGAPDRSPAAVALLLGGTATAAAAGWLGARRLPGRTAFRLTLAAVALVVAGFLLAGRGR